MKQSPEKNAPEANVITACELHESGFPTGETRSVSLACRAFVAASINFAMFNQALIAAIY